MNLVLLTYAGRVRDVRLGWELWTFLVLSCLVAAGWLTDQPRLIEVALGAVALLTPVAVLSVVFRAVTSPQR